MQFQPHRVQVAAGLALALALAAPPAAATAVTGAMELATYATDVGNYNLITLGGGATFSNYGSIQGPLAIGGNLSLSAGTIASAPASFGLSSDPTLYVTGTLSLTGTVQLASGYASLPGETATHYTWNPATRDLTSKSNGDYLDSETATGPYATSSPLTNPGPSGNFSTAVSDFTNAASVLAATATSGTISVSGGALVFSSNVQNPTAGSVVVFSLDASKISGSDYNGHYFTTVQVSVPADVNYVIDVINASNTTLFGSAVTMTSGTNDNQLLWNIEGSSTVTLGGNQFYGSILAPSATIVNGNALITGQVVARSFDDTGKQLDFAGFAAVVAPEPPTYALWGCALCGAAVLARRRFLRLSTVRGIAASPS